MKGLGCIEKEEQLNVCTVCSKGLVLRSEMPFPGYYSSNRKGMEVPEKIFLMIKSSNECIENRVVRLNMEIKAKVDFDFSMNYSHLRLLNKMTPCIAIIISDVTKIDDLLIYIEESGIEFLKTTTVKPYTSRIQVRKFAVIEPLSDDIYSGSDDFFFYIAVQDKLSWKKFTCMIKNVRNSKQLPLFDAAQFTLYNEEGIFDFIRIYSKSFNKEHLVQLQSEIKTQWARIE